jgi:hypothetical protein
MIASWIMAGLAGLVLKYVPLGPIPAKSTSPRSAEGIQGKP